MGQRSPDRIDPIAEALTPRITHDAIQEAEASRSKKVAIRKTYFENRAQTEVQASSNVAIWVMGRDQYSASTPSSPSKESDATSS